MLNPITSQYMGEPLPFVVNGFLHTKYSDKFKKALLYSCNISTSGLPDIYTQSTRAAGPRVVYIRQTTSAHVTTVMYHLFIGQKPT